MISQYFKNEARAHLRQESKMKGYKIWILMFLVFVILLVILRITVYDVIDLCIATPTSKTCLNRLRCRKENSYKDICCRNKTNSLYVNHSYHNVTIIKNLEKSRKQNNHTKLDGDLRQQTAISAASMEISEEELKQIKWNSKVSTSYGTSPIVLPNYNLIFFAYQKSGCTYWKYLFEYINGNIDEMPAVRNIGQIHNPDFNGLQYLVNFSDADVRTMMTDDAWVKATLVREPRERLLSAYLHKAVEKPYIQYECGKDVHSFDDFLEVIQKCPNPHWESQVRVPARFYKGMKIGKMENITRFTEDLLQTIGAWNDKVHKWIDSDNFITYARHATNAKNKLHQYYDKNRQDAIFSMYSIDYEVFGFNKSYFNTKK